MLVLTMLTEVKQLQRTTSYLHNRMSIALKLGQAPYQL